MGERTRKSPGSASTRENGERRLYAQMLRDIAAEMRLGFDAATKLISSIDDALQRCKTPEEIEKRINPWDLDHLFSWQHRRPRPVIPQPKDAKSLDEKRFELIVALLRHPSRAKHRYAEYCAELTGYDSIPEVAKITIKALKSKLLRWPPSLVRRAESPSNPLPKNTEGLRGFWEDILSALTKAYKDRFSAAAKDPFKPLVDRIAATEILAELIDGSTAIMNGKSGTADFSVPSHSPNQRPKQIESSGLIVSKESREARWNSRKFRINAHADFLVLAALFDAIGKVVPHRDLLRAVKPAEADSVVEKMTEAPQEVKDAIGHVRAALSELNAPYDVKNLKGIGYRLRSTDE